jgi:hypothetical protein
MINWRGAWREPWFWSGLAVVQLAVSPVLWDLFVILRAGWFLDSAIGLLTLEFAILLLVYRACRPEAKSLLARFGRGAYEGFTIWFLYLIGSTILGVGFILLARFAGFNYEGGPWLVWGIQMAPAVLLPIGGALGAVVSHLVAKK